MKKEETSLDPNSVDNNREIKDLLVKNLEIAQRNLEASEGILVCAKYIKSYIFWKKVAGIVVWTLIVLSTLASLFYLPTLVKDLQSQITNVTPGLLGF